MGEIASFLTSNVGSASIGQLKTFTERLVELGVESVSDLIFVSEEDLDPLLQRGVTKIQIRKLLKACQDLSLSREEPNIAKPSSSTFNIPSTSTSAVSLARPSAGCPEILPSSSRQPLHLDSSSDISDVVNWASNFRFKDKDFSDITLKALKGTKRLTTTPRLQCVREIASRIHSIVKKPGRKALKIICTNLAKQYPVLNLISYTGRALGNGNIGRLGCVETRIETMNRGSTNPIEDLSDADEPEPIVPPSFKRKNIYGCIEKMYCPSKLPDGENKQTQENNRHILCDFWKSDLPKDWDTIMDLMSLTYVSQRWFITLELASSTETVECSATKLLENWPFLFNPVIANQHMKALTGVDFLLKLKDFLNNEGSDFIQFLIANCNKDKTSSFVKIKKEMDSWGSCGFKDLEIIGLLKMLAIYFGEDVSFLMSAVEPTTLPMEVNTDTLPLTPVIIALGSSEFSCHKCFISLEHKIVNDDVSSFLEAFGLLFCSYFNIHLAYPKEIAFTLEFIQRQVAEIDPDKGTKRKEKKGRSDNATSSRVLNLMINYDSFKREFLDSD